MHPELIRFIWCRENAQTAGLVRALARFNRRLAARRIGQIVTAPFGVTDTGTPRPRASTRAFYNAINIIT